MLIAALLFAVAGFLILARPWRWLESRRPRLPQSRERRVIIEGHVFDLAFMGKDDWPAGRWPAGEEADG